MKLPFLNIYIWFSPNSPPMFKHLVFLFDQQSRHTKDIQVIYMSDKVKA